MKMMLMLVLVRIMFSLCRVWLSVGLLLKLGVGFMRMLVSW